MSLLDAVFFAGMTGVLGYYLGLITGIAIGRSTPPKP